MRGIDGLGFGKTFCVIGVLIICVAVVGMLQKLLALEEL